MGIDTLIKTVLSELQVAINSKTVIGNPITEQGWTLIPVTKVSFGFGAGGGEGKKDAATFGGGSGGGASIEPIAFVAINPNEVKLISLKGKDTVWEKIINMETAEKIYKKIMGMKDDDGVSTPTPSVSTPTVSTPAEKPPS
ncbi:MAG: sporulation protein [Candidatus Riflebacteria bacterium]|nr:sporulation protein [Candidatus Riflebacteria bacterium]